MVRNRRSHGGDDDDDHSARSNFSSRSTRSNPAFGGWRGRNGRSVANEDHEQAPHSQRTRSASADRHSSRKKKTSFQRGYESGDDRSYSSAAAGGQDRRAYFVDGNKQHKSFMVTGGATFMKFINDTVATIVPPEEPQKSHKTPANNSSNGGAIPDIQSSSSTAFQPQKQSKESKDAYTHTLAAVNDIEKLAQKKGFNSLDERFKVMPDYAYPNTFFNREELRMEMNRKSSYFHDLRIPGQKTTEIGYLRLEILQCFGVPTTSLIREVSAYCVAVCGSHAFKTDVMPSVANPMWLSKMRRACMFPLYHAFARLYVGVFDNSTEGGTASDFAGRVCIDVARLRPGCTYDITLPLRQSTHIFSRAQRGAIRLRFHLVWRNERAAVLSYLPKKPKFKPNENVTVNCMDDKAFRNVAQVVHGMHMPGKFSMTLLKATSREMNFLRIHILRYMRKREVYNLIHWQYPFISGFVFAAWMHSVIAQTVRYVPGHILTFFLLHLWKNYVYYASDSPLCNGFMPPTFEELLYALIWGGKRKRYIEPLQMEMDEDHAVNPLEHIQTHDDYEEANTDAVPLHEIAESLRKSVKTETRQHRFKTYKNCFTGSDAVDFLVSFGFAFSREEAVELGQKLAKETKLFEHVERKHDFEDMPYFYVFLDYDTKKYVIKAHDVMGKNIFRTIGFAKLQDEMNVEEEHVEFPFATGRDHPRFTVKQSIVIRSSEARKLVKVQENEQEMKDCAELGVAQAPDQDNDDGNGSLNGGSLDDMSPDKAPTLEELLQDQKNRALKGKYDDDSDEDVDDIKENQGRRGVIMEVKILKKPPNQDLDVKRGGGDKAFTKVLEDTRHKVHGMLLHLFNDRVYKIDESLLNATTKTGYNEGKGKESKMPARENSSLSLNEKIRKGLAKAVVPSMPFQKKEDKKKKKEKKLMSEIESKKDEYDQLLKINKYSHNNPWINRVAVIVQPIIETAQLFICLFRSLYNIYTWQDPIFSFWIAFLGPFVVLFLHFAPWRLFFGITGIVLVGPQNWLMRLIRESRDDYEPPDFDKIVKKKKKPKAASDEPVPLFSSEAPGNRPIFFKNIDRAQLRQVVVPYSRLKYQRFYDWPPEPEYAKVFASPPPMNDPIDDEGSISDISTTSYWYDGTLTRREQKKKEKRGLKKVAQQAKERAKKGAGAVVATTGKVTKGAHDAVGMTQDAVKTATRAVKRRVSLVGSSMRDERQPERTYVEPEQDKKSSFLRFRKKKSGDSQFEDY